MLASVDTVGNLSALDTAQLAQNAQAGSIEAFDILFKRYEPGIYRYLVSALRNHEEASDFVQLVFVKAWRNLANLQNAACFKVWLYSIARNLLRDHWRGKKPSCQSWEELAVGVEDTVNLCTPGPEERIAEMEWIGLALAELAPKLRYCLVLRVVGGYNPCEIASRMGICVNSVVTYISLARRQLRDIFARLAEEQAREEQFAT